MLNPIERPLSDSERQHLTERLHGAHSESRTALLKTGAASAAVCGVLMVLTLWLSDAPAFVILVFWACMATIFALWIGLPWRRLMREQIPILEDGLRTNRARERRVRSDRVVEFEEEEDEGACYAFAQDGGASTIFVIGQEFYEDDDFPNSDFGIVEILGGSGRPIDVLVAKHGRKLAPERVIPADVKNQLDLPEHLDVVETPVEQIESALRRQT
jgi:hypothetical protein